MATLFLENNDFLESKIDKLKSTPYSFEYDAEKNCYRYEIISYGFEHLIPQVLLKEMDLGLYKLLQQYESIKIDPTLKNDTFTVSPQNLLCNSILMEYQKNEILEFQMDSTVPGQILIKNIKSLKKLKRNTLLKDNNILACKICEYVFSVLGLMLTRNPSSSMILSYDRNRLKKVFQEYNEFDLLKSVYPMVETLRNYPFKVPLFYFYFKSERACLHHYFQMQCLARSNSLLNKPLILIESPKTLNSRNYFSFLRCLDFKEYNLMHIGDCKSCKLLQNPISEKYGVYCSDPFVHKIRTLPLKGFSIVEKKVYIWTKEKLDQDLIKKSLFFLLGCRISDRFDKKNWIYIKDQKVGCLYTLEENYVIEFDLKFILDLKY